MQHDMVIDNADGRSVRLDFSAAVQALVSCSSGTTPPATTYPGMLWLDLSVPPDGVLRQRDQANLAWLPMLMPPDFRFTEADMFFGARTSPNRFVWNDKFDGTGNDIMTLDEFGILSVGGPPVDPTDVPNKGYVDTIGMPVGAVIYVAMSTPPLNYLKANGASLLRNSFPSLFTAIGTAYGAVDSSHFNVPELRGEFIRGWDDGRGLDAGRLLGSVQMSDFASHTHTASAGNNNASHAHTFADSSSSTSSAGSHTHPIGGGANVPDEGGWSYRNAGNTSSVVSAAAGAHTHTVAVSGTTSLQTANHSHAIVVNAAGGADTRPRNVSQLACIKYQ